MQRRQLKNMRKIVILSFLILGGLSTAQVAFADCPQARKTMAAPAKFLKLKNPLPLNAENIRSGKKLFNGQARPIACATCHGIKGNGKEDPDFESTPSARDFTCTKTMEALPDGQLFWIIKNGSNNTSMFAFSDLSDNQTWQLVHYIRQFSK
jgi:mono/diheme cytochrome c family protein